MTFDEMELKGLGWTQAKREYQSEVRRLYLKYCDKVIKHDKHNILNLETINAYTYGIYSLRKNELLKAYNYWKELAE